MTNFETCSEKQSTSQLGEEATIKITALFLVLFHSTQSSKVDEIQQPALQVASSIFKIVKVYFSATPTLIVGFRFLLTVTHWFGIFLRIILVTYTLSAI